MPLQVSPGINVSEIDLTLVVPNVATSIGAMAGSFQWGPVLERTSITTENDLVRVFGKPNDDTQEYFHTCSNYLAYSNNLKTPTVFLIATAIQIATKNEIKEAPMAFVVIAKTPTLKLPFINPHFKFPPVTFLIALRTMRSSSK